MTERTTTIKNNWALAVFGLGLIVLGFMSGFLTEETSRGGRVFYKVIVQFFTWLGPDAALAGIPVGIIGIVLVCVALKRFPILLRIPVGIAVGVLLLCACGISYSGAMAQLKARAKKAREREKQEQRNKEATESAKRLFQSVDEEVKKQAIRDSSGDPSARILSYEAFQKEKLELGLIEGELAGKNTNHPDGPSVFLCDEPVDGVVFYQRGSYGSRYEIKIASTDDPIEYANTIKPGEALYGLRLHVEFGKIKSVHGIFGVPKDGTIDETTLRDGRWLGKKERLGKYETVTGGGNLIYGFVLHRDSDIVGISLILKE